MTTRRPGPIDERTAHLDVPPMGTLATLFRPTMTPPGLDEPADRGHDPVYSPAHYAFTEDPAYEPILVIEAWGLGFCLGNTVKYVARAGRKDPAKEIEDLKKARWYLDREISRLEDRARNAEELLTGEDG